MVMIYKENSSSNSSSSYLQRLIHLVDIKSSNRVLLIVCLYSFINVLSFRTLGLLSAAVYTILIQLKVLTTAFFGVYILQNNLTMNQWISLFHLVMGSILIVGSGSSAGNDVDEENSDYVQGILMVLVIVTISGYSAVFMEKIFKTSIDEKDKAEGVDANEDMEKLIIEKAPVSLADSPATPSRSTNIGSSSIWERNFQLAFYSMLLMLTILVLSSAVSDAAAVGPFSDWSTLATVIVVLQGSGGLIAGATLKYTNANLKTLATTLSIVFSTILEYWLMGLHLNLSMLVGIFTIIVSISSFALNKT